MKQFVNGKSIKEISPLVLAYIGDSVFDLLVRRNLITKYNMNPKALHQESIKEVCCLAQSHSIEKLMSILTDDEIRIYKNGRNAHVSHVPKSATPEQYHKATGLEALFGYLYLNDEINRIKELFEFINKEEEGV